ncbi:MAG: beta-galactosidase [Bryobacteraceae bacterium]
MIRSFRTFILLYFLAAAASVRAADIAYFEAGQPRKCQGLALAKSPESIWRVEPAGGGFVVRLKPAGDYFTRAPYVVRVSVPVPARVWLVAEFLDKGYGLIAVSPGVPERNQWGVARVNSGQIRRAVFHYEKGEIQKSIQFAGLDYLRSVRLTTEEPRIEPVPLVRPAVDFKRPSQRVTTAAGEELSPDHVADAPAHLRNRLPLVRALGFNGVESYVKWHLVERSPGVFDWSFYDSVVDELEKFDLKWFPMVVGASGYALPEWFYKSKDNVGFVCLEHGIKEDVQSIFYPRQAEYVRRFLAEFGRHYSGRKALLGVRLGPSGDYGEAQYPAKGPGFAYRETHNHIGYWAGDEYAQWSFRQYLRGLYGDVGKLNEAWTSQYASFDEVRTFLPETARVRRQRIDFATWYLDQMSQWCEKFAIWMREALPNSVIHQSSGGWGPIQIGTDYTYQARSMSKVQGGIRLTNESDNFPDNFTITRMASSAARFYGIALGYEPGGYASKRGVMARLFNAFTTGAEHLFYYLFNLTDNDHAIDAWLRYGKLLDERSKPVIEVASFYPDTAIKLDDDVLRYRWGSPYFTVARALRAEVDYDYCSEQMILDGALARYKVLVFLWGHITEKPVLERMDRWVRNGGTVILPIQPRGLPGTPEGDTTVAGRWASGDTGKGKAVLYRGDAIPGEFYARFIREQLKQMPQLNPAILAALRMSKPPGVYWSALESGKLALLNFSDEAATLNLGGGRKVIVPPYEITLE